MEEEVVEVATKVAFSFKPAVLAAASILSLAAGVNIGFFVANRRLKTKYEELANTEIAEAKDHYARMNKTGLYASADEAARTLLAEAALVDDGQGPIVVPDEVIETIKSYGGDPRPQLNAQNVFAQPKPSLAELSEQRFVSPINTNGPYVITEDEFNDGEVGYAQCQITYYDGDGFLADDKDIPVEDVDALVGDALQRFGEGSGDAGPHVVFVRNSRIQLDFEVTRSMGKYSVEVAGLPDTDLQHSAYPARRRRKGV